MEYLKRKLLCLVRWSKKLGFISMKARHMMNQVRIILPIQPSLLTLCNKGCFAGEMSVPKQQKFYTDDIRSLRNLVRGTDLWTQKLYCFSYCLQNKSSNQCPLAPYFYPLATRKNNISSTQISQIQSTSLLFFLEPSFNNLFVVKQKLITIWIG